MRLYTKVGDRGETALFGGAMVPKNHLRVTAYGEIDETNANIGLVASACDDQNTLDLLAIIQGDLFVIGAILATPKPNKSTPVLTDEKITQLEAWIDEQEEELPPVRQFILPGGSEEAARLQVARTVCRRAERSIATLMQTEQVDERVLVYVNRLSDLMFTLARRANQRAGVPDMTWSSPHNDSP